MRIVLSPEFISRLNELEMYVANKLSSPKAASDLVNEILDGCSLLERFPFLGREVSSQKGQESEFRLILVRHFMVIYCVTDEVVRVSTLIDGRSDEIKQILRNTDVEGRI